MDFTSSFSSSPVQGRAAAYNASAAGQAPGQKNGDLWSPGNKGVLVKGEQKITHEELLRAMQVSLSPEQEKELKEASRDFESFFLYYLLKLMDQSVPRTTGLLGDTHAMRLYREMFYERLADTMAERGMGLQDVLSTQLTQFLLNKAYK